MKVFVKLKLLSVFIAFLLFFNFISLPLMNLEDNKIVSLGTVAQFFSAKNFPVSIIEKMFLQKMQENKQNKKTNKTNNNDNKFQQFLNHALINISSVLNFNSNIFVYKIVCMEYCFSDTIEYPLKIPFWQTIFLLLILKLLFNVLPRSISINYNKNYIEKACIV